MQKITPCLWFNNQAEKAVAFYTSIFKNSSIGTISHYDEAGAEVSGMPRSVMTIEFTLDGQTFTALNGDPAFTFSEAISFIINCDTQKAGRGMKAMLQMKKIDIAKLKQTVAQH